MNYADFLTELTLRVKERMGSDACVSIKPVLKNNSRKLDSLMIMYPGENVSPSIYVDDYYPEYSHGRSMQSIVDEIEAIYSRYRCPVSIDTDQIESYDFIRNHVYFRLINQSSNKELLEDLPYIPYLDLAIVFYMKLEHEFLGTSSALIHNDSLESWGISKEDLFYQAYMNTHSDANPTITPMSDMISGLLRETFPDAPSDPFPRDESALYILTNDCCTYGASCMLFKDLLSDFSFRISDDFYILPSSIHELILIGLRQSPPAEEILHMVREINHSVVRPEDVLSDHIYRFHADTASVELI